MTKTFRAAALTLAMLAVATGATAAIQTKEIEYRHGETTLQGYLAWDDAARGARPGVLVVHEWWGHNDHARRQAERLAKAGYVGFALDMFGKGKVTTHPADAQGFVQETLAQAGVAEARFAAALEQLKSQVTVDRERVAAIGYCFGGGVVLEMARSGADLDAVASFHGSIGTRTPAQKGKVKAQVLVMTGAADPFVPEEQVMAFEKEMKDAAVRHQVIRYPGAKHGFTNPDAGTYGMEQLRYDADADAKSWDAMLKFFRKALK